MHGRERVAERGPVEAEPRAGVGGGGGRGEVGGLGEGRRGEVAGVGEGLCGRRTRGLAGALWWGGGEGGERGRGGGGECETDHVDLVYAGGHAAALEVAVGVALVAGGGRLEGAAADEVEVVVHGVGDEGGAAGGELELAAELVVLADELCVVLLELADAEGGRGEGGDLVWGEGEDGLELRDGLLELWVGARQCVPTGNLLGCDRPARCRPSASRDASPAPSRYGFALGDRRWGSGTCGRRVAGAEPW